MEEFLNLISCLCCIGFVPITFIIGLLGYYVFYIGSQYKKHISPYSGYANFNVAIEIDDEQNLIWKPALSIINPLRKSLGKAILWTIPRFGNGSHQINQASKLYLSTLDAIEHAPLEKNKKILFEQQASLVPFNISKALWKQNRLSILSNSINHNTQQANQSRQEIQQMIKNLEEEKLRSLDILTTVSVSLMSVEIAHGDMEADRLLQALGASNQRLRELSDIYKDSKFSKV